MINIVRVTLLCAATLFIGCQAARMPISDTLSTAERLPVEGRQGWKIKERLRFGSFEAHAIDRSWVRGRDLAVSVLELNKRKQHYTFALREATIDRWHVGCEALLRRGVVDAEVVDVEFRNRSELVCTLYAPGDAGARWTLSLTGKHDRPMEGTLISGSTTLAVHGTRKLQGGLPAEATTGYEIAEMTRSLAAVEVMGDGAVWLSDAAQERRAVLAAAAAALLLLEDLRAHLPQAL